MLSHRCAICMAFLCVAICFAPYAAVGDQAAERRVHDAVVRVTAGTSVGSGCVFYRDSERNAYVLTNYHVAGRRGTRVSIEFWRDGQLQKPRPGVVVLAQINNRYVDCAVVRVAAADLADLDPPFVPLATPDQLPDLSVIASCGSPGGVWPSLFVGRTIDTADSNSEVLRFHPRPGGGRSGSPILSADQMRIVGLLAWSTGKPGGESHNVDGRGYNSGHGIAMSIGPVWKVLQGQATDDLVDAAPRPPHETPLLLTVDALQVPADDTDEAGLQLLQRRRSPAPPIHPPFLIAPPNPGPGNPAPQIFPPQPEPDPEWRFEPGEDYDDENGLRDRRRRNPEPQPDPAPPAPGLGGNGGGGLLGGGGLRGDGGGIVPRLQRPRPMLQIVTRLFWLAVVLLAAIGGGLLLLYFFGRQYLQRLLPIVVAGVVLGGVHTQAQDYDQRMRQLAARWSADTASDTAIWERFADAQAEARASQYYTSLVVLIHADNCAPCKRLRARLEEWHAEGMLNHTVLTELHLINDREAVQQMITDPRLRSSVPVLVAINRHPITGLPQMHIRPGDSETIGAWLQSIGVQ